MLNRLQIFGESIPSVNAPQQQRRAGEILTTKQYLERYTKRRYYTTVPQNTITEGEALISPQSLPAGHLSSASIIAAVACCGDSAEEVLPAAHSLTR